MTYLHDMPPAAVPTLLDRRRWLQGALSLLACAQAPVLAAPRVPPRADSPPVGVDSLVLRSGLTARWTTAMRQDMGWKAQWQAHDSLVLLRMLEDGSLPMAVFLGGPEADALDRSGLIHDRRTLALTDVLLVGPKDDLAGLRGESDWARAIMQVLSARVAGVADWEAPPPSHALATWIDQWSQGFTRQGALVRPASRPAPADSVAYTVVPRAAWRASAERDRKVWLSTAPEQALSLQVARSFRSRHPGAGLLVKWLEAPLARRQVRALAPGWRLPGA